MSNTDSTPKDLYKAKIEQEGRGIKYKKEPKVYNDRKNTLEQNLFKSYKYILGFCIKTMKSRIKEQADYDMRIKGNKRNLLKEISNKMYDLAGAKYEYLSLTQSFKQLLNIKQEEEE